MGVVHTHSRHFRLTWPFYLLMLLMAPKGGLIFSNQFVFLEFRRISRLSECSKYFTLSKAFQESFTWCLYLLSVQAPLGSSSIQITQWPWRDEPTKEGLSYESGLLSGILLWSFRELLFERVIFSLFLFKVWLLIFERRKCFLEEDVFKESVMEAFLILVSFLGLLTIKSFTCLCDHPLFHYCSGMGSEQNWWKPWLPGADGLEGCQEGEWSVLPSQLFLDLLCCRVFSVSLYQLLHWKGTKLISTMLDGEELQQHC